MKKCPYCSSPIEDNAKFCIYCMKELEGKAKYLPLKPRKSRIILTIIVALLLFIAIIIITLIPKNTKGLGGQTTASDIVTTSLTGTSDNEKMSEPSSDISTENETEDTTTEDNQTTPKQTSSPQTTKPQQPTSPQTTKPHQTTPEQTSETETETETEPESESQTKPTPDEPVFYELVCEYRDAMYADSIYAGSMAHDIEGKIIITKIVSCPSDGIIMIPETIDGKTVYGVQYGAFDLCADELKVLIVPAGVQKIDNYSLKGCDKLTDIYCFGTVLQLNEGNPYDYVRVYDGPNFHCTYDCHNGSYSSYRIYAEYWGVTFVEWDEKTYDLPR